MQQVYQRKDALKVHKGMCDRYKHRMFQNLLVYFVLIEKRWLVILLPLQAHDTLPSIHYYASKYSEEFLLLHIHTGIDTIFKQRKRRHMSCETRPLHDLLQHIANYVLRQVVTDAEILHAKCNVLSFVNTIKREIRLIERLLSSRVKISKEVKLSHTRA